MKRAAKKYLLVLLLMIGCSAHAQQPLLSITSPADGVVVKPGDTVSVAVSADSSVQDVGVVGSGSLPEAQETETSGQFQLTIPAKLPLKKYFITANGTVSGLLVHSKQIHLDVERPDAPVKLEVDFLLTFRDVGKQLPLSVNGVFADGANLDMTYSSRVSYTSRDTTVATVNAIGMVTAVGSGKTFIVIKAGSGPGATGSGPDVAVEVRVPHKLAFSGLSDRQIFWRAGFRHDQLSLSAQARPTRRSSAGSP